MPSLLIALACAWPQHQWPADIPPPAPPRVIFWRSGGCHTCDLLWQATTGLRDAGWPIEEHWVEQEGEAWDSWKLGVRPTIQVIAGDVEVGRAEGWHPANRIEEWLEDCGVRRDEPAKVAPGSGSYRLRNR